jgi:uncharacterized protein (DUF2252 family)
MWNRNLYKRSFKRLGICSWRQYFQEEILAINNNDETVKEHVKSMIELATNCPRTAPKKTSAATTINDELLAHFNANAPEEDDSMVSVSLNSSDDGSQNSQ